MNNISSNEYYTLCAEIDNAKSSLENAENLREQLVLESATARELHKDFVLWQIKGLNEHIKNLRTIIRAKTALMEKQQTMMLKARIH